MLRVRTVSALLAYGACIPSLELNGLWGVVFGLQFKFCGRSPRRVLL